MLGIYVFVNVECFTAQFTVGIGYRHIIIFILATGDTHDVLHHITVIYISTFVV